IRGSPSRIVNLNSIVRLFPFDFFLVKLLLLNLFMYYPTINIFYLLDVCLIDSEFIAGWFLCLDLQKMYSIMRLIFFIHKEFGTI
ncbi:hypothetical protein, partial [Bacillus cereus]|uniref:hypothetical protein n=1 Tax=Bacillus cereus TaxID=1396 RepID=UPI0034D4E4EE